MLPDRRGRGGRGRAKVPDQVLCVVGRSCELSPGFVAPGDLLLVKGSRGVKMERIVEALVTKHAAGTPLAEKVPH